VTRTRDRTRKTHAALARQVVGLTNARQMQRGDPLPEQMFAGLCGVSRTPMRSAFKILEDIGFLERPSDSGYCLALDPESESPRILQYLDAAEGSLADRILADRGARRLEDMQSVSFLIRRYGTTRTAVLNALTVLQQDGIVERVPGQSWAFRPILDTPAAVADSLQFRLILEPAAIRTPGFDLDPAKARHVRLQMTEALHAPEGRLGGMALHRQDTDFHELVAQGSANRFARDALLAHHRLRRATQKENTTPEFRLRQAIEEHLEILDSLERRQFDVAADQMTLHLRLSRNQRPDAANRGSPPMMRLPGRAPR
jgi:DNA-binding GntR family transcriptional regulator